MEVVQVGYAKAHFLALLDRVEQGEEFAIARRGKVIARLVPVVPDARPAIQALEKAWAMGGFDLPDQVDEGTPAPLDDVQLD